MSWVLILCPRLIRDLGQWPAIIGGYPTRESAEAAGKAATEDKDDDPYWSPYSTFIVIPGAANTPPDGPQ